MVAMDTSFSYQLRVAACDRCGAPCEAAVAGGSFACRFCNAQNMLGVRDEGLVAPTHAPIPEMERLNRLRMQDGKPLLPPPSLMSLMDGGGGDLPEWKLNEAVAIWNATRQELRTVPGNYEAAERLVFLTMVLAQKFQAKGDKLRQRSTLEGALDAVTLPRHRQILRGFLGRAAVRSGDIAAAEAWLKPCDPQSDDLQMDSAWRFTRAFIDTAKGDYPAVLRVLGQGPHDFPIEDASDDVCGVFRANAWEKLGRPDQAVALLRQRMEAGGQSRATVQQIVQLYADWHVCAMSYPQAASGYAAVAGAHAASRASGGIHVVFIPIGLLMGLGGLGCIVGAGVSAIVDDGIHAAFGLGMTGVILFPLGLVFLLIGLAMKKSAQKAAWLRMHGISAKGRIQSVSPTGLSINDVPQVMFTVLVELPGRPPYQAHVKALMSGGLAGLGGGGMVPLRVHPQNPSEVLIEMD